MLNAIPNPQKTLKIDKSLQDVKDALSNLYIFNNKYKMFKDNPGINQITYEATEFLSLGVYIDLNYSKITEIQTEINIEVRRKIGSFNQSHEVTNANNHIVQLTDLISQSLSTDQTTRIALLEEYNRNDSTNPEQRRIKLEAAKEKAREQREKQPVLYYSSQIFYILLTLGLLYGLYYIITLI